MLALSMAISGTIAYLSDTDSDVNVMTLGNVKIDQTEWNDEAATDPFTQDQPLYPAYYPNGTATADDISGEVAKYVKVENKGTSEAYIRTVFAFEGTKVKDIVHVVANETDWSWEWLAAPVEIKGVNYTIAVATYPTALAAKDETPFSLNYIYMDKKASNDDVTAYGETYEVLVQTQAVQTVNLENLGVAGALDEAFGKATDENIKKWFGDVTPVTAVHNAEELKAALAEGGTVRLAEDIDMGKEMATIPAGKTVTLDLNGHDLKNDMSDKDPKVATALITVKKGASLTINGNGNVHAVANKTVDTVSAIINNDAGNVTINGGNYTMDHGTYAEGYLIPTIVDNNSNVGDATLTINGGTFTHNRNMFRNFANAASHNGYKTVAKIVINGGAFIASDDAAAIWNQKPSGSTPAGAGAVEINGGTFANVTVNDDWDVIPSDPAEQASDKVIIAAPVYDADDLIESLENKKAVVLLDDVKIDPAGMSNAYGTTGINVKNGQTIDGNGNTLDIKGAGGTWDSGICTSGGLIKDLTVTGSFRGIFVKKDTDHNERVILENVTLEGVTYTISVDSGTGKGLTATNSTFKGWTSYAKTLGDAKFVDCYFGEGSGYAYCRPYAPTEFVGCAFEAGYTVDPVAAVTFEDCTIGGKPLTADNLSTLVTNPANATVK